MRHSFSFLSPHWCPQLGRNISDTTLAIVTHVPLPSQLLVYFPMEDKQQVAGWGKGWDLGRKEELMGQWGVLCLSQSDLKCASAKVGNWWVSPQQWLQEGARVGWTLLFTFPSGTPFPLDSFREPTKDGTTGWCSWALASRGVPSLQPPTSICPLCWVLPATLQPPPPGKQPFLSSASLQGCYPDTLGSSILHLPARWAEEKIQAGSLKAKGPADSPRSWLLRQHRELMLWGMSGCPAGYCRG